VFLTWLVLRFSKAVYASTKTRPMEISSSIVIRILETFG